MASLMFFNIGINRYFLNIAIVYFPAAINAGKNALTARQSPYASMATDV